MTDIEKKIKQMFYNPSTGYLSESKLYKKLHEAGIKVSHTTLHDFLIKQYTSQVNKQYKQPTKLQFSKVLGFEPQNIYQIDIIVYDRYEFHNYKYILCCIDVYSRYVQCRAMTNRNMSTIMEHFKSIMDEMGNPKNVNTDNEFNKSEFNKYCKTNNITTWFSQPNEVNKNVIVERFNRTLATMLQKWRSATGLYTWYKVLPKIVNNYNTTYHSTIQGIPKQIFNREDINRSELNDTNQITGNLKIGDKVRVLITKNVFDKNDVIKYSKNIFTISDTDKQKYILTDDETNEILERKFKYYELQKIKKVQSIPKKNNDEELHNDNIKQKKITKFNNKEGVEVENISARLRVRKPKSQLEHEDYGNVFYS